MENFTPLTATVGGLLIGLATTLLWLVNGRTAGISSIAGEIYPMRQGAVLWRILFLAGLPVGALAGATLGPALFAEMPTTAPELGLTPVWLVIAGVLVGAGTRLGNGCTSGHGICGLSRLSVRSFAAVGIFMAMAIVTVFVMRHVIS